MYRMVLLQALVNLRQVFRAAPCGFVHFVRREWRCGHSLFTKYAAPCFRFELLYPKFMSTCLALAIAACSLGFCDVPQGRRPSIVVENKVLATVRDQIITVLDVSKKMDMIFYQQFPQYRGISEAKYEFYRANWRRIFQELVDRQLILSMAEEKHFEVTNGDIREEMEEIFGPNAMLNLYEEGLLLHDVEEMMKADILLRRALSFYVHSPVVAAVTPSVLRVAYKKCVEGLKEKYGWVWRSVTVRFKEGDCPKTIADQVWERLQKDHRTVEQVSAEMGKGYEVVASSSFRSEKSEVAPGVQAILEQLQVQTFSEPQPFTSRSDQRQGWRCYIVDERVSAAIPPFEELEPALRHEIADPVIEKRTIEFFEDLRKEYGVKQLLSSEELLAFEPFLLKEKAS